MTWLQLRLDAQPDTIEALEDVMLASGAVAVTMEDNADDPVLEPGVKVVPVHVSRAEVQQAGTPLFKAAGWVEPRPTSTIHVPPTTPILAGSRDCLPTD